MSVNFTISLNPAPTHPAIALMLEAWERLEADNHLLFTIY